MQNAVSDAYVLATAARGSGTSCTPAWGTERRVLGSWAVTKFSEEILKWAGTHKVLEEQVSVYGNFR